MDPINSLNQIMRTLRRQLSEKTQRNKPGNKPTSSKVKHPHSNKLSSRELQQKISTRISNLDQDSKNSPKALQIFIESVLTWEFGDEILQDSSFTELSNQVQKIISSDPATEKKLSAFLNNL